MARVRKRIEGTTPLALWLSRELKRRNLSGREASEGAGLSHYGVSRFLLGETPTPDSCQKLARYLGVPRELLLQLAGHISPPADQDLFLLELAALTEGWSEPERRTLVELARTLGQQRQARP